MSETFDKPQPVWTAVGPVANFPAGRGTIVKVGHRRIGVYPIDGTWYALKDTCPHAGVSLAEGPVRDGAVMCVGHGWTFSLATGEIASGPAGFDTPTYPVRIKDGQVEIGT